MKRSILAVVLAVACTFAAGSVVAEGAHHMPRPLRAEGISPPIRKPLRADGMTPIRKPLLACNQNLCHIKRPLVAVV